MTAQLDLLSARTERDHGIARVADHSAEEFRFHAESAIRRAAAALPELIVDDVWAHMPEGVTTHDLRAMGAVMLKAVKDGVLAKTERYRPSAQKGNHANPRRVWKSNVYREGR